MKKLFGIFIIICLCIIIQSSSVFATENQTKYLTPDAVLIQSEDKNEIVALAPEIVEFANLFEAENVHATENDIDFSGAYCIYIDADIFAKLPLTRQNLEEFMSTAPKVWVVPVRANGKTVFVQVSKALEINEIDTENLLPDELAEAKERAGKWHAAVSTYYEDDTDYAQQLQNTLTTNRSGGENKECILFGGVPGIQSVIAILLDGDTATGVITLERDIIAEGSPNQRGVEEDIQLKQNEIYSIESFAKGVEALRTADDNINLPDNTGGGAVTIKKPLHTNTRYIIPAVIAVLFIVGIGSWRIYQKNKK